jgi:hypothetical protein
MCSHRPTFKAGRAESSRRRPFTFLSHSKSRCKQSTSFQTAPNVCERELEVTDRCTILMALYIQEEHYHRTVMKQSKYGSPFEVLESALHHTQLQARLHAFAWHVTHQAELYLSGPLSLFVASFPEELTSFHLCLCATAPPSQTWRVHLECERCSAGIGFALHGLLLYSYESILHLHLISAHFYRVGLTFL